MNAKTARFLLLPLFAAITISAGASPTSTDEARAEAAKHNAEAEHAVSQPSALPGAQAIRVTDTDSARSAAALANARSSAGTHQHESGAGIKYSRSVVRDTDSARAAAAQRGS